MTLIHSFKRRTVLRIAGLLFAISLGVYLVLSYRASLYTTVPSGPLWSSSLPTYSNQWNYTAPSSLRQPNPNFKAAFVTLTKGDRAALSSLRQTIRDLEDNFNKDYGYPYIIFSNDVLTDEFKELASSIAHGDVVFYELGPEMYGYHNQTDRAKAAQARIDMGEREIMFGDSEDYRFAARFMAGMIFRHPALEDIDYYWRFEPGTEYMCPILFDPFQFMFDHGKKISFSMALYEYEETIPSLFNTVMEFAGQHPDIIQPKTGPNTLWHFIIDAQTGGFNRCHFWSNFQIADLNFFRGEQYQTYFDFIDKSGGIFYERWGDPVIQTLGAVLFLEKQQIQFWQNIGYRVANFFTHCPPSLSIYSKCSCQPSQNFDFDGYSCLRFF